MGSCVHTHVYTSGCTGVTVGAWAVVSAEIYDQCDHGHAGSRLKQRAFLLVYLTRKSNQPRLSLSTVIRPHGSR